MEFLKWIGSVLLSIAGLCVILGGVAFALTFGALIASGIAIFFFVGLLAAGIKEYLDDRAKHKAG